MQSLPHPESFLVQSALGWLELGLPVEARRELGAIATTLQQHPDVLEAWWRVFGDEGRWTEARECAVRLRSAAPGREAGWINEAFALHELKRTAEAFNVLVQVADKFPCAYVIPYNLACYQCRLGRREEALGWLHRAILASDAATIRAMASNDPDLAELRAEIERLR